MDALVLVVGNRSHSHAQHIKLSGEISVGRGFACDVVLNDAYVDPVQLIFHIADGVRTVEVLAGTNATFSNGEKREPGIHPFHSGDEWDVGKTSITAFLHNHVLAPTEKIATGQFHTNGFVRLGIIVLALAVLIGFAGIRDWLSIYAHIEWDKKIPDILTGGSVIFVVLWPTFWAIVGRVVTGRSQFTVQLVVAVGFVIALGLSDTVGAYLAYAVGIDAAEEVISSVGGIAAFTALFTLCFSTALNFRRAKYVALGFSVLLVAFIYLAQMATRNPLVPEYNKTIKPPFAQLAHPGTVDDFMQGVATVFADKKLK